MLHKPHPLLKLLLLHLLQSSASHQQRQDRRGKVGNRSGIHDTVDSHQHRQHQNERQQEDDLSGQCQQCTAGRLADRSKEIRGDRLDAVEEGEEQVDAEVTLCKSEVFLAAAAKQSDDLSWEEAGC